jgi:hypothetical protein
MKPGKPPRRNERREAREQKRGKVRFLALMTHQNWS